jgi:hypothetical protein
MRTQLFIPTISLIIISLLSGCFTIPDVLDRNNFGAYGDTKKYEDPRTLVESTRNIPIEIRNQIIEDAKVIKGELGLPGHEGGGRGQLGSNAFLLGIKNRDMKNRWNDGVAINAISQKYFPNDLKGADKVIDVIAIYGNGDLKDDVRENSYRILEAAYMHQAGEVPYEIGQDKMWNPAFDFGAEPAKLFQYLNKQTVASAAPKKEVLRKELSEKDGIVSKSFFKAPYSGVAVSYHRNGRLASSYEYVNGKKEGLAASWYDNGQQEHEMHYIDNKLSGKHIHWDREGNVVFEVDYIEGVAN